MESSQGWQRALRDFRHQVYHQVCHQVYQWQMGQGLENELNLVSYCETLMISRCHLDSIDKAFEVLRVWKLGASSQTHEPKQNNDYEVV